MTSFELPDPDRQLDARIHEAFCGPVLRLPSGPIMDGGIPVPAYTSSIDAATGLVEDKLPGWVWRLCRCSVSDDAWLMPDFNNPDNGPLLNQLWPECVDPLDDGPGLDASFSPAGRPALGLVAVFLDVVDGLAGFGLEDEGRALRAMAGREQNGELEQKVDIAARYASILDARQTEEPDLPGPDGM